MIETELVFKWRWSTRHSQTSKMQKDLVILKVSPLSIHFCIDSVYSFILQPTNNVAGTRFSFQRWFYLNIGIHTLL